MSHFLVGVFSHDTEGVDELLAPYNEQDESFCELIPASDEAQREARDAFENREDLSKTFEDFILSYAGLRENENGELCYFHNPNAKWDWYDADGGRWANCSMYRLRNGEEHDEFNRVTVRQMDFSLDMDKYHEAEIFWDEYVLGKNPSDEKYRDVWWNRKYYLERYASKEDYAMEFADVQMPYAFVTPDGEWVETGSMGWWGLDSSSIEQKQSYYRAWRRAIEKYQDCYLTYVDCHI